MRKILTLMFAALMMFAACNPKKKTVDPVEPTEPAKAELTIGNAISTDRQYMYLNYGGDYRWYETCVVTKDFIDSEEFDGTVQSVSNVFQVVSGDEKTMDVHVILFSHTPDTTAIEVKHGFWVEDFPLNDAQINVTFEAAVEKMMETNCPKPHSQHCVLRHEIGPKECNPQYIFGNVECQVYVDAVTGDVSTTNPAFGPDVNLCTPLGEWP